jgi:hypothetical protein
MPLNPETCIPSCQAGRRTSQTERVLIAADAYKWTQYFTKLYARPEFAPVWAGEVQGVGQLWAGSQPAVLRLSRPTQYPPLDIFA